MLETAITAARAAGALLKAGFGQDVQVNREYLHDLKIQADEDAQAVIFETIRQAYPDHKLIGEEGNCGNPDGETEWIVDPLDGTMNFAHHIPHFCTSIAVRRSGKYLAAVIYDPIREELYTASETEPTKLNGREVRVSPRAGLGEAVMGVGFAKSQASIEYCLELYRHYGHRARKLRAMGSAALDMAYVAAGRLDAYIEQGVNLWDVAAGVLLVEQAGGEIDMLEREDGSIKIAATSGNIEYPLT
ncbi:MAG: inositol monophosphatase family protein [Verrucomicrobiota bacterium]